jgi:hypothetical protein
LQAMLATNATLIKHARAMKLFCAISSSLLPIHCAAFHADCQPLR